MMIIIMIMMVMMMLMTILFGPWHCDSEDIEEAKKCCVDGSNLDYCHRSMMATKDDDDDDDNVDGDHWLWS